MVVKKLQKISISFNDKFGFPLFNSMPKDELSSIQEDVEIEDSLRAKLADLCNIIDRVDQKKLNAFSSCLDSKGSKMSLTNALKKGFPTQHSLINEFESVLDMVFLARDFFIHRRNRYKTKLFDFYAISEESSPKEIWIKIYEKYEYAIDIILQVFENDEKKIKQNDIDDKSIKILKKGVLEKLKESIEQLRPYLAYMLSTRNSIQDNILAEKLGVDVKTLRKDLWNVYPNLIKISYNDEFSTNVSIKECIRDELELFMKEIDFEN